MASIKKTFPHAAAALGVLLACIVIPLQSLAADKIISAFAGPDRPVSQADLGAHPTGNEQYTESWGFVCALDDGAYLLYTMMVSNVGIGDNNPGLDIIYIDPEGKVSEIVVDASDTVVAAQDEVLIDFGFAQLFGEHPTYRLKADTDVLSLDATVTANAAPRTIGSGRLDMEKGHYWQLAVLVPRGRIAGHIVLQGRRRPIAGWVYADHTWSDVAAFSFSRNWMSARIHTQDMSIDLFRFETADNQRIIGPMILSGPDLDLGAVDVTWKDLETFTDPGMGFTLPRKTRASAAIDGYEIDVVLTITDRIQAFDAVKRLSPMERTVIKAVLDHIATYRYEAHYTLDVRGPKGTISHRGTCLVEMVYFKD